MSDREKWITVLVCLAVMLIFAGAGIYRAAPASKGIAQTDELQGKRLGGIEGRMPPASAKIFFESMLGVKLSAYKTYRNTDEALYALRTGKTDALWFADVTADYLTSVYEDLREVNNTDTSDIMRIAEERFEFGLAAKNNDRGQKLIEEIDFALGMLKKSGRLNELTDSYITGAAEAKPLYEKDLADNSLSFSGKDTIKLGITGAAGPVELVDGNGRPYGFCVAMAYELGSILGRKTELIVLDNETEFSSLMSGRIDAVFCYGTPGRITTEGKRSWIMSEGYLTCDGYRLISLSGD